MNDLPRPLAPRDPAPAPPAGGGDRPGEDGDLEPEVVARLRQGDRNALGEVFAVFGARIHNTCRRITGSDSAADDATQEVFLRVLAKASTFDGRSRFSTWLFRLAVNHTINLCRSARRRAMRSLDDGHDGADAERAWGSVASPAPQPLETVASREERRCLDEALQSLPADQRAIVVLREVEGLSYAEIAAVLDLPAGTVTSRLVRGRERLAQILRRRLTPEELP